MSVPQICIWWMVVGWGGESRADPWRRATQELRLRAVLSLTRTQTGKTWAGTRGDNKRFLHQCSAVLTWSSTKCGPGLSWKVQSEKAADWATQRPRDKAVTCVQGPCGQNPCATGLRSVQDTGLLTAPIQGLPPKTSHCLCGNTIRPHYILTLQFVKCIPFLPKGTCHKFLLQTMPKEKKDIRKNEEYILILFWFAKGEAMLTGHAPSQLP